MTDPVTSAGPGLADSVRDTLRRWGEAPRVAGEGFGRLIEEVSAEMPAADRGDAQLVAGRLLVRTIKEKRFELRERVLELESLYDLGLALAGTLDIERLADEILIRSVSLTNSRSGSLVIREETGPIIVRSFGREILPAEAASLMRVPPDGILNNSAAVTPTAGVALRECEKCLVIPIQIDGRSMGLLAVADKETRDGGIADFLPADVRLLSLFANQAATAIETARLHREALEKERLEREMQLAAAIQAEILPRDRPRMAGLDLAAENRPTRHVGGDYFDFFPFSDRSLGFVVADVSGKGVPAALLVSTLSSAIHLQIGDATSLGDLASRVNRHLCRFSGTRKFVTLFFGRLEIATGELEYFSAGHNPAMVARRSGSPEILAATGRPLGMFIDGGWGVGRATLDIGDRLCVYTDGMTEALNPGQEEFGCERLEEILADTLLEPVGSAAQTMFDAVSAFAAGEPQYDDQTLLLLSRSRAS